MIKYFRFSRNEYMYEYSYLNLLMLLKTIPELDLDSDKDKGDVKEIKTSRDILKIFDNASKG